MSRFILCLFTAALLAFSSLAYATFPGQNGKIVFVRNGVGICLINPDGSGETVLTNDNDHDPEWSADGTKILFARGNHWQNLYTMNADGSNATQISQGNPNNLSWYYMTPSFSPDGSQIVFWRLTPFGGEIWKMNADGSNEVLLLGINDLPTCDFATGLGAEETTWSPDGSKIAFDAVCSWNDGMNSGAYGNIFVMNSNGTDLNQITNNTAIPNVNIWDYSPEWSPDGTQFLFTHSSHSVDYSVNEFSTIVANIDGSNAQVILGPSSDYFVDPTWSPDGTKIVFDGGNLDFSFPFSLQETGTRALYVMNPDGTNITPITDNSTFNYWPSWQPIPPTPTPTGSDVIVQPIDPTTGDTPATLTFDSVIQAGQTTISSSDEGTVPPSGFKTGEPPVYYEVSTTAIFNGTITLCFKWTEGQFQNENAIGLFHYESGNWIEVTTSLDTTDNEVCGQTTSLSPFALFETSYIFTGFFSPIDNLPTRNQVKAGSAVPVKFSLGGDFGLNIFDAGYPASQSVQCDTNAPIDDIEEIVQAGQSSLTYDPATNQYKYIWKTNTSWKNQCRRLILNFNDGSIRTAEFKFK